jgi:hypothetical protein
MATNDIINYTNENHSWQVVANKLKVPYVMGGENVYTWHDQSCQGHTLVAK